MDGHQVPGKGLYIKKNQLPGNSAGDLFGMVKTWAFLNGESWPTQRLGMKFGHGHWITNLKTTTFVFLEV